MNKKDLITHIICLLILIFMLSMGFFVAIYNYQDCQKVGHSNLYCVLNLGK